VTTFNYSPEVKTRLVLKAYEVIHKGRLEFDAGWNDMAQSLMAIRKTITQAAASSPTSTHCRTNRSKGRPLPIPLRLKRLFLLSRLSGCS